jgi:WD40 repeat protein
MTLVEPLQNRVVLNFQCLEIRGFAWSPDNRLLAASGRGDAGVYLLDLAQRKLIQTLPPAPNGSNVYSVAWSPDGKRLAAGDGDGNVEVFDVRSGNRLAGARLHTAHVYSLVWSEDGRRVVSGSEDRTVRVWDPENCNEFLRLDTPSCENHQLLWSPDGRKIIAAGNNGEVSIWDATAGFRYATSDAIRYER